MTDWSVDVQVSDSQMSESMTSLPNEADLEWIRLWASRALASQAARGELAIRLIPEAEMQQLNRDYRGKDAPTNVLSFPMEMPDGYAGDEGLLGDIAICMSIVDREAQEQGKPRENHLAHMVVHGCLHVLGYDHQTIGQAHEMESLEVQLLGAFDIPDPYQYPRQSGELANESWP